MGQTVSLNSCIAGGSNVKVMKPDGQFAEFEFPTSAAEVMIHHPGNLVVHCSTIGKNSIGQRPKITIMLPDQPLLPGQPYMLYPIPENHKKSLARSKSFSLLRKRIGEKQGASPASAPAEKRKGRRRALKLVLTRLHLATFVASTIASPERPRRITGGLPVPQIPQNGRKESKPTKQGGEEEDDTLTLQLPKPSELNFAWRPMLSTIPESPLGFHSNPQSPLGLYKMDSFSKFAPGTQRAPGFVATRSNLSSPGEK